MKYHPIGIKCPQCHQNAEIDGAAFRPDGMVLIDGICKTCQISLEMEISYAEILANLTPAIEFDLQCWKPKGKPS